MMERTQSAVLRVHHFNKVKDPQAYYYSHILLYMSWHNEEIVIQSPKDTYNANQQQIEEHAKQFNHHEDEIDKAAQHLQQHGVP